MSDTRRIRVTINEAKIIPFVGKGPIRRPIAITKSQYDILLKLGYNVKMVEDPKPIKMNKKVSSEKEKPTNNQLAEDTEESLNNDLNESSENVINENDNVISEETTTEDSQGAEEALEEESTEETEIEEESDTDSIEDNKEDTNDETLVEENEELEEEVSDETENIDNENEFDAYSMSKSQLKTKLDELGVNYNAKASVNTLRNLLLENLPSEADGE